MAEKWERAADALRKTYSGVITEQPGTVKSAYELAFSGPLCQRIEHHLGKKIFFTNKFHPKILSKDDLLNSIVQEVIDEVLEAVEKFKKEHTDWSRSLKLLPSPEDADAIAREVQLAASRSQFVLVIAHA